MIAFMDEFRELVVAFLGPDGFAPARHGMYGHHGQYDPSPTEEKRKLRREISERVALAKKITEACGVPAILRDSPPALLPNGPVVTVHLFDCIISNNSYSSLPVGEFTDVIDETVGALRCADNMSDLKRNQSAALLGNRIFIGHGHSKIWMELRDFIEKRLGLPVEEFNRVPIAGYATVIRLKEMLDEARFAFIVMTGEDMKNDDDELHARENVIHEAGLFQGRLGFERAIILVETGCKEFSNIEGLGHIPFRKDHIEDTYELVRQVLEREEIIRPTTALSE